MARIKNKFSGSVEKKNKKINPFEVHINKERFKVLGKKTKNDRGIPGISREKALSKRKKTLQVQYKLQHKSNKFFDKRIGEGNVNMSDENRITARYTTLKAKKHNTSNFNLADEEMILTHKGQILSEIEKFESSKSDDDDSFDEDSAGKLNSEFVEEAHFGGGFLKKTNVDGAKSHKDLINQLIAESKKRKAEKQKLKEETLEFTGKLNDEWKDLQPLVYKTNNEKTNNENEKSDDYDQIMRQLKFEARGKPTDRLKDEDELAKEEKIKLEKLEEERLKRMHGLSDKINTHKQHISADDLDDNFAYDSAPHVTLSYNTEGHANVSINAELNGKIINSKENGSDDESDKETNEETTSEDDDGDDDDNVDEDEESEDSLSDLKEDVLESESEEEINENKPEICNASETIRSKLLLQRDIMQKAREELPYTYKIPSDYENFQTILQNESAERQHVIIERMIKCNHPSLGKDNKELLSILFTYMLQYINDIAYAAIDKDSIKNCFCTYSCLMPHMFDLAQINVDSAHKAVLEVIKEKQLEYRKHNKNYPGVDTLLFLKLSSCLFPTSDFRHMVITPSILFLDQMLNNCKVRSSRDISTGLFVTTLVLEYTKTSQRFLPSAINFLAGILHMCIPKTGVKVFKIPPPFKSSSNKLVLFNNWEASILKENMDIVYLVDGEIEDEYKITVFYVTLCLLEEFLESFKSIPSNYEIFLPIENFLVLIPINNYPMKVREKTKLLLDNLKNLKSNRGLVYLVMNKQRPKALRLYDPQIEKIFDMKKHKIQSKEKAERDKLIYKLKKEQKGALREIRRDKAFLAKLQINERMQSDNERKDKVRKLLAEASIQQSELNQMDRKKRRK